MTQFRNRPVAERIAAVQQAEQVFELWAAARGLTFEHYGFSNGRVAWTGSYFVNYTPDYVTEGRLWEVQGFGHEGILRFKVSKLQALRDWNVFLPVFLFVYDEPKRKYVTMQLDELLELLVEKGFDDVFDGHKPVQCVAAEDIDGWGTGLTW